VASRCLSAEKVFSLAPEESSDTEHLSPALIVRSSVSLGHVRKGAEIMRDTKTTGIVETVAGGALALWVYVRFTNVAGQLHTWSAPFDDYELNTLLVGALAFLLLVAGVVRLTKPKKTVS
jgi:TRAP-type C4-dicarboxylate transport system permease large subunit